MRIVVLFVAVILSLGTGFGEETADKDSVRLLGETYPGVTSGALSFAVMKVLPVGVLLEAGTVKVTDDELQKEIQAVPETVRDQVKKNALFFLEQMVTGKLLMVESQKALQESGGSITGKSDKQVINEYLETLVSKINVSDEELKIFYDENKDMIGNVEFNKVKEQLRQYLVGQKQQETVNEHIRTIGKRVNIAVAAGWAEKQVELAADNPVDKARKSGLPSLVDFGADGCRPCDMMAPILETLRKKYIGKLNVEFIHVQKEQVLAARYGISSIPVQIFFDSKGNEFFRHTGFFPQDEIEKKLNEMELR